MHRLHATISAAGRDQNNAMNECDATKIRSNDLRFIDRCLEGDDDDDECKVYAARLLQLGLVELCQQICIRKFSYHSRVRKRCNTAQTNNTDDEAPKEKKTDQLVIELDVVLSSVVNLTDISVDACQRVIDIGFYKTLFDALWDSLSPGVLSASFGSWNQSLADNIMTILYNVVQVSK